MTHDVTACPRCASTSVRPLGHANSPLEWYACRDCHHVWAAGVPVPPPLTAGPDTSVANDQRRHVLVVDDDVNTLGMIERVLADYRVSTARDGLEALAILSANDAVHLLLTDYLMPVMTGEELVRRARVARPDLRVLVITGYSSAVAVADPEWWASERLLVKPFRMDALRRAVEELIGPPSEAPGGA